MDANQLRQIERPIPSNDLAVTDKGAQTSWSGPALIEALNAATSHFKAFVPAINALNVFPVPDGDTGTNMHLTLTAAMREIEKSNFGHPLRAAEVMTGAARGALMGARGNSGVILYQVMAGLAESAADLIELDGRGLAAGLRRASDLAYQAVVKPVEGTMLTVIREAAEAAELAAHRDPSLKLVLQAALDASEESLKRTPDLLDILRQAGVVDAGGQGLVVLLDGLNRFAHGMPIEKTSSPLPERTPVQSVETMTSDQFDPAHHEGAFGYCTNFAITGDRIPVDRFRARMNEVGESAVIVGGHQMLKVHIHSEHPGTVLEAALEFGELHEVRIDNMDEQARALRAQHERHSTGTDHLMSTEIVASVAVVAVATGDGIAAALKGLGVREVIYGGPTFNPSTEDILEVINRVPQDEVILLPNDPNVIATAKHVDQLTSKIVRVVPSTSIPEGISALSAYSFDAGLSQNSEAMSEALDYVTTMALTRASRDAEIDGIRADAGQYIGLICGDLRSAGEDPVEVVLNLFSQIDTDEAELVTLFVGEPAKPGLDKQLANALEETYANLTVEIVQGGQPHYDLIISME